jgi:hypothetical protein
MDDEELDELSMAANFSGCRVVGCPDLQDISYNGLYCARHRDRKARQGLALRDPYAARRTLIEHFGSIDAWVTAMAKRRKQQP